MHHQHLLDRRIGPDWPDLSTTAAVAAFEAVPYDERIAARSTYEAHDRHDDAPDTSRRTMKQVLAASGIPGLTVW